MYTPPNPTINPTTYSPIPSTYNSARRRPLPSRSSLSNSFSFAPPPQEDDHSLSINHDSSFSLIPRPRSRIVDQGNSGIGAVSPRIRRGTPEGSGRTLRNGNTVGFEKSRLGGVEVDMDEEDVVEEEEGEKSWDMVDSMRLWRHDAIMQHLYETAAFWGDKILSWTGDPNDAFWLAQTHFLTGHYLQAERLLTLPLPHASKLPRREGLMNGNGKGKEKVVVDDNAHGQDGERGKLVDESLACRYLAAQCLVQQEKYHEALELLGEAQPFAQNGNGEGSSKPSQDDGIKLHSSISHLRALLHLRSSSQALAKESFIQALVLDVKNYDAFRELIEGGMMSSTEEWEFIQNLSYRTQLTEEQARFVKMIYTTRLRKDAHIHEIARARADLVEVYGLGNNPDVLVGLADELFTRYRWEDCYSITSKILKTHPSHQTALPLHLACMYHIHRLRSTLFMLAHDLVEQDPGGAVTWYAVGLWYFSGKRWTEARRWFSKANLIDSRFAPAWIAFAHSFAYEGEHDHAITAYSTSARLFQGSHLPLLCIGMEHLQLNASNLAEEYYKAAEGLNPSDPLVLNELGVVAYNREDYASAIKYFVKAIETAKGMQGVASIWAATHCNLGHAYRLIGQYDRAQNSYTMAKNLDPTSQTPLTSLAIIAQLQGNTRQAIKLYHQALSLNSQDPMTTVLLEMALKEQVENLGPESIDHLPEGLRGRDVDPFGGIKGVEGVGGVDDIMIRVGKSPGDLSGERSGSRGAGGGRGVGSVGLGLSWNGLGEENVDDVGEGSTMDIEDD